MEENVKKNFVNGDVKIIIFYFTEELLYAI